MVKILEDNASETERDLLVEEKERGKRDEREQSRREKEEKDREKLTEAYFQQYR